MKKRIVSLLLCIVMLVSLLSVNAFAAEGIKLTAQKVEAELTTGATVKVAINITENPGIVSGKVTVNYDSTALEFVKADFLATAKGLGDSGDSNLNKPGVYVLVFGKDTATANTTFTGKAFELTFKVLDGATAQEYPITLTTNSKYDFLNLDANGVAFQADNGSITLKAKQVAVSMITVSSKTLNLEVGQTRTLTATVTPDNATDKTVTWTTSNDKVATVANDGTVTAVGAGTATITATAANGKKDTCKVTVKVPVCNHSEDKLTHVDGKAATCTENGVKEHYLCKCGTKLDLDKKTVLATTVIPATGHTVVKVDKVDPTCNTTGMKAHYECSVCGKWFSDKKGTKEIADAEKASYVIAADPDMHVYDIVKDSYKEYDEGYYVEQFQCTKCGDSYWLASVDLRDVDVKLVQDGKGDLKNAKVEVTSTSVKTKEVMSFYYNDTANAGDTLRLPVFFNYSKSATEAEAIAALKKDIAENSTFTVKAAATKSGWKFTTDKTYTVTVELDDAGKVVTKWVGSDNTEVSAKDTPTFTITGKKNTGGGGNGGSGNGGSTTTDTTKTDGKKVESGKTFDAGIAMYVGLSVLSVTGGALVIGKKKERF